jgi:hypothetical protein
MAYDKAQHFIWRLSHEAKAAQFEKLAKALTCP